MRSGVRGLGTGGLGWGRTFCFVCSVVLGFEIWCFGSVVLLGVLVGVVLGQLVLCSGKMELSSYFRGLIGVSRERIEIASGRVCRIEEYMERKLVDAN